MSSMTVTVTGHWMNAWFIYPFARPYVVIDGAETRVRWGRPQTVSVPSGEVELGAGIRLFDRGRLLGYEPHVLDSTAVTTRALVLRNGGWNHEPFRVVGA